MPRYCYLLSHLPTWRANCTIGSLLFPSRSPLLRDLLAPPNMVRIHRSLTLDAAVPIEVTSTAPFGRNTSIVGAVWIGAGLGGPVAAAATEYFSNLHAVPHCIHNASRHDLQALFVHAGVTKSDTTHAAQRKRVGLELAQHLGEVDEIAFRQRRIGFRDFDRFIDDFIRSEVLFLHAVGATNQRADGAALQHTSIGGSEATVALLGRAAFASALLKRHGINIALAAFCFA